MQLYVLDIDDTVTKTAKIHQEFFTQSINEMGIRSFNDDYSSYKHHTDRYIFGEIFQAELGRKASREDLEKFEQSLVQKFKAVEIKAISGAVEFIRHAEERGMAVVFATGAMYKTAALKLDFLGIPFSYELLIASNEYFSREEIVSEAITRAKGHFNLEFERIISFGDGVWDYKTAENLGLEFIGIGKRNQAQLKALGVKEMYDDFQPLLDFNFSANF